jgi:tRNA-splicing ligase RtcB
MGELAPLRSAPISDFNETDRRTGDTMRSYSVDASQRVPIKMWTNGVPVEEQAAAQLRNVAALPFIHKHVAVMPDVHWGMGATVGSVIPTKGAIVPAAVGVDIGCGMMAQRTSLTASDLPDNLGPMRSAIEAAVPHGRTDNGGANDRGSWGDIPADIADSFVASNLPDRFDALLKAHPKLARWNLARISRHVGTLGTGNHFVEVCLDTEQRVWVMLHSGSRGIGNAIGSHFIELAKKDMERWFINVPDKDLAYIPQGSEHFGAYWDALKLAQSYAALNRRVMMRNALKAVEAHVKPFDCDCEAINCHHNYVSRENHFGENVFVTRKGAVSAKDGELGIIPGSMGARSFIVRGKGNPDSFCSCSHGAGRAMSRGAAKKRFTLADHEAATAGVECRKDADVIDETPGAYKDIQAVMDAQADLVSVEHTLKQVLCVKG